MTVAPAMRIPQLRDLTRSLNLHVPPSYFTSSVVRQPYEEAIRPITAPGAGGPLHLYVGIPLCEEHCSFCMYFYGLNDQAGTKAEACLRGLEHFLAVVRQGGPVRSIAGSYIGGGTPTVLSASQIGRLLTAVNTTFTFETSAQRTFEMSPRSATPEKVQAIVAGGYDRVSFGVQSFDPAVVAATGRAFVPPQQIAELIRTCDHAGVAEVNADLMVGLTGEQERTLADSVRHLLLAGCPTISVYRYRPARKPELEQRGGMDAYIERCTQRVQRAVEVVNQAGWHVSGQLDGEHIRLMASGDSRWPVRNLYETRFRPELTNSLIGIGIAARSFLHDQRMIHCGLQNSSGYKLAGREVEVEICDEKSRVAAALVNSFFRDKFADAALIETHSGTAPEGLFADEFEYLVADGVLLRDGRTYTVAAHRRSDWPYLEKLFYPSEWIERRARPAGLRIR